MSDIEDHPLAYEPDSELLFKGPYTKPSLSQLRLTNKTDRILAFKVKTTAPRMYSVMPTHGFLPAKSCVTIFITLNVKESEQDSFTTRVRHKFLIQSAFGPEVEDGVQLPKAEHFWKELTNVKIYEHKLQCTFELEFIGSVQAAPMEKKLSVSSAQKLKVVRNAPLTTAGQQSHEQRGQTVTQQISSYLPYVLAGATALLAIYYFTTSSDDQTKHKD